MPAERSYRLLQVDAFADRPLGGNPCAVLLDTLDLDDATMLAIAREMNLSETAFVGVDEVGFRARYFTPAEEIPLAGHPTLATARALLDEGRITHDGDSTTFALGLRDGPVRVELRGPEPHVFMSQRRPRFLRRYPVQEVLPLFGLEPEDALPGFAPTTVSTGTPMLMVPLRDRAALSRARLRIDRYDAYRADADFFSPHLFALEGFTDEGATAARHFGVPPDALEDPFTGSATGAMAAYCWHTGLLRRARFVAEQGHVMGRPGKAVVEVDGTGDEVAEVRVGGATVTVVRGTLTL